MSTVTGTVEAVSKKYGKFSILLDDVWYNTKEEWAPNPAPNKGDTVEFDNGGSKFIQRLKITGEGSGGGGGSTYTGGGSVETVDRQSSIVRQNALTNAVSVYTNLLGLDERVDPEIVDAPDILVARIIHTARMFEQYTSGKLDALEKAEDE